MECLKRLLDDSSQALGNIVVYGMVKLGVNYEGDVYDLITNFKVDRNHAGLLGISYIGKHYLVLMDKVVLIRNRDLDKYIEEFIQYLSKELGSHLERFEPFCYRSKINIGKVCLAPIDQGTYSFTNLTLSIKCLHHQSLELETSSLFHQLIYRSGNSLLTVLKKAYGKKFSTNITDRFSKYFYVTLVDKLHKGDLKVKDLDENVILMIINHFRR